MAYTDELDVGEPVTVRGFPRTEARWIGTLVRIVSPTCVVVQRDRDGGIFGMHPSFVTPMTGDADE